MAGEAIDPISITTRSAGLSPPPSPPPDINRATRAAEFSAALDRHMQRPRQMLAEVRAEIDSIRSSGRLRPSLRPVQASPASPPEQFYRGDISNAADPYGWRATARQLGDTLIAPGYGSLYERQIQQESAFDPEVAFGFRRSSAGAEGIAQLMPQYYPGVDRSNPRESLVAGARTMQQYLAAWDGDVRKALASYNAGLGRVRSLVEARGVEWEQGLPAETRSYLDAIVGSTAPRVTVAPAGASDFAIFGGAGAGGVLTTPLDRVLGQRSRDGVLDLLAAAGSSLRAPAEGRLTVAEEAAGLVQLVLDHGNGWLSTLRASGSLSAGVTPGSLAQRGQELAILGSSELAGAGQGLASLGLTLDGLAVDPARYLLRS